MPVLPWQQYAFTGFLIWQNISLFMMFGCYFSPIKQALNLPLLAPLLYSITIFSYALQQNEMFGFFALLFYLFLLWTVLFYDLKTVPFSIESRFEVLGTFLIMPSDQFGQIKKNSTCAKFNHLLKRNLLVFSVFCLLW